MKTVEILDGTKNDGICNRNLMLMEPGYITPTNQALSPCGPQCANDEYRIEFRYDWEQYNPYPGTADELNAFLDDIILTRLVERGILEHSRMSDGGVGYERGPNY